ncbi:MAG TPA: acetamidase, partial [Planctomycetaceae bacterium]|nr:acetamidase [Planctomycetaceae bacterium]
MEHNFIPSHYFTTLGPHEPVLTVEPGDSIVTTTVDARGGDENREQATPR